MNWYPPGYMNLMFHTWTGHQEDALWNGLLRTLFGRAIKYRFPWALPSFEPLLGYFRKMPGMRVDEEVGPKSTSYGNGLHPCLRAAHYCYNTTRDVWHRIVVAYIGERRDTISRFSTDTVRALCATDDVCMPVLADAFMDAGLAESHWLLRRLRDQETPFVPGEWFHRVVRGTP